MKKQILSIAILTTLPFGAWATDPVGPAAVPANGTAVVATDAAPYQTMTIENDDKQHIASTAYIKGAYNDTIAAVNKIKENVDEKQDSLYLIEKGERIPVNPQVPETLSAGNSTLQLANVVAVKNALSGKQDLLYIEHDVNGQYRDIDQEVQTDFDGITDSHVQLISGLAVKNAIADVNKAVSDKRVTIYTTWDNDTAAATRQVELSSAQ